MARRVVCWAGMSAALLLPSLAWAAPAKPLRRAAPRSAPRPPVAQPVRKVALEIADLKTADQLSVVTSTLSGITGVKSAFVDLNTRLAVVDYDPVRTSPPRILVACAQLGFPASEYRVEQRFPKPIKLKSG